MSQMVADPSKRSHFINTTIAYVRKYGFDGIDIDWEFPTDGSRGGSPSDAAGFAAFVSDLRIAIDNEARGRSTKLLLSSIVPGGPFWGQYYLINQTIADLDWVNILAYNVLGTWGSQTDCSAPLENPHNIQSDSVANALKYYLQLASQRGVRGDKFNLGLSFWGIAYKLKKAIGASSSSPGVGTPSYTNGESPATPGFCTRQPGYLAYFEIDRIRSNSSIISTPVVEDGVSKCQYFTYNSDQWVAYDDQKTLSEKIDLGLALGLTGVSVWGMDADKPGSWDLTESVYSKIIN